MQQSANPTAMSRNHNVRGLFGGVSEGKLREAARREQRATGGTAMVTLTHEGLFRRREETVRAEDISAQDLKAADKVSLSAEKTGLGRLLSADPVLAEGTVDGGVARVSDKAHRRAGPAPAVDPHISHHQNRIPEMREAFEDGSMVRMIRAVQAQASNNNRAAAPLAAVDHDLRDDMSALYSSRFRAVVDSVSEPGEAGSNVVSLFGGDAAQASLLSAQPSSGVTAADIDDAVRPELRVVLFSEFLRAAAANSNTAGGKDFLSGGSVGALPVFNWEGINHRISGVRERYAQVDAKLAAHYVAPKGLELNAA